MNIKELINNINESEYQELFGVKKDIFEKMVNILQKNSTKNIHEVDVLQNSLFLIN